MLSCLRPIIFVGQSGIFIRSGTCGSYQGEFLHHHKNTVRSLVGGRRGIQQLAQNFLKIFLN